MSKKGTMSPEHFLYSFINSEMNRCDSNYLMRALFEEVYIFEGYKLDWNKRLNDKGEWVDKEDVI